MKYDVVFFTYSKCPKISYIFIPHHRIVTGYYGFSRPSSIHAFVFLFLEDNLSKCQWIFTKLGMCIDIVEIWFEIANGQIPSTFD